MRERVLRKHSKIGGKGTQGAGNKKLEPKNKKASIKDE